MAYLRNLQTNKKIYLLTHHTFGRRRESVDTHINEIEISKIHAIIEWHNHTWQIRDLSKNGTWINKQKVPSAQNVVLKQGQTIYFANLQQHSWIIEDLEQPRDLLLGMNSQSITQPLTHYTLLPNNDTPTAALFFCKTRDCWVLERFDIEASAKSAELKPLPINKTVRLPPYEWQLFLLNNHAKTSDIRSQQIDAHQCYFNFETSLDEEHTKLCLNYLDTQVELGERSHHYLLLHLARQKAKHADEGIDPNNQGWIDNETLAQELGIEVSHINIQIFRARKQMAEVLPNIPGLPELIERRRGSVRFNCSHAQIIKGKMCENLDQNKIK